MTLSPLVRTATGRLQGHKLGSGVLAFKGVRYAEDPTLRRFQPAEPLKPWNGIEDALYYGHECPQNAPVFDLYSSWANPQPQREDCLFLNIWTPAVNDGGKRPVMVWLHGGGHSYGSGNELCADGERLARNGDVVAITVTHRLNAFGLLYLPDLLGPDYATSGTVGMLDIVEALRWIRSNIEAFGGDPDRVMIYGQSGGGAKVAALMAMPVAKGLFHRAAIQSGPGLRAKSVEAATDLTHALLGRLNIRPENARALLTLPYEKILAAVKALHQPGKGGFEPVMDGIVLPHHPFDPAAPDCSADVPLLIGTTETDMALAAMVDATLFDIGWDDIPRLLTARVPGFVTSGRDGADLVEAARGLRPDASPSRLYFELLTEATLRTQTILLADRKAGQGQAPVYMYMVGHETPIDGGKWGSPHGIDIPLHMDTLPYSRSMFGEPTDDARKASNLMRDAWVSFARGGNPATPDLPDWTPYIKTTRSMMILDARPFVTSADAGLRSLFSQDG